MGEPCLSSVREDPEKAVIQASNLVLCLFVIVVVAAGNLLFVLVGSGALPLWTRKAPPLVAPPTS